MQKKKGLIALIKEKLFSKSIDLNTTKKLINEKNHLIEEKHPIKEIHLINQSKSFSFFNADKKIKSASSISEAVRLSEMNKKVDELIQESIHSHQEIHEEAFQKSKNFSSFNKMNLDKTEKKLLKISSKSKKLKAVAVEVKKHLIITDFDRINSLIKEKQKISLNAIAKNLKLTPKRVAECANILEKAQLIEIEYPALGAPQLMIKGFKEKKQKELNQKKEIKKK